MQTSTIIQSSKKYSKEFFNQVFSKSEEISWRWEDDRTITIAQGDLTTHFRLNKPASVLFYACNGKDNLQKIMNAFPKYLPNVNYDDIISFIDELTKKRILTKKTTKTDKKPVGKDLGIKRIKQKGESKFIVLDCQKINKKLKKEGKIMRFRYPPTVIFSLIYTCNLDCNYCYVREDFKKKFIPLKEAYKTIDKIAEARSLRIKFQGGEPLLYQGIFKVIKYAKEKGMITEVLTNASLLNSETIDRLKSANLDQITVGLDAAEAHKNALTRTAKMFDDVLNNIKEAVQKGIRVYLISCLGKTSLADTVKLARFANDSGVSKLRFRFLFVHERTRKFTKKLNPLRIFIYIYWIKLFSLYEKKILNRNLITPPGWPYGYCVTKQFTLSIDTDGKIKYCEKCPYIIGSLKEKSVADLWRSNKFLEICDYSNYKFPCNVCFRLKTCGGSCRAYVYETTGDIFNSNPDCFFGKIYKFLNSIGIIDKKEIKTRPTTKNIVLY